MKVICHSNDMPAVRPPAEKHVIGMADDRLKKRSRTGRELLSAKQRTQILKMNVTKCLITWELRDD
jgi:hypothetical protein